MRWRYVDADLYHQWEEAENRAEKWERTAKEERKQYDTRVQDTIIEPCGSNQT